MDISRFFLTFLFLMFILLPVSADLQTLNSSELFITIDPIGNHTIGEVFFINGTTNLPISENLSINVFPALYHPVSRGHEDLGFTNDRISIISQDNGIKHWSINVSEGHWANEVYIVTIGSKKFRPDPPTIQFFTMSDPPSLNYFQNNSMNNTSLQSTTISTPSTILKTPTNLATPIPAFISILAVFIAGITLQISGNYRKWR